MTPGLSFEFATAARVLFGPGRAAELPALVDGLGSRALVCTGARPERHEGLIQSLPMPFDVFTVTGEPTVQTARAAVEVGRARGADLVIAIGGGSALDLGKAAAMLLGNGGDPLDYLEVIGLGHPLAAPAAPCIAIPTTAGTGSEVARGAIVIVDDGRKLGFHSWHLVPKTALLDPDLTLGLPAFLTAATGMDAIAHCMETFMAPAVNPPADGIGLDGLERAWRHIERAMRDGSDREARWNMMSASMQGAMAFQKGLGCVHSLSHSLGGVNPKLHHGTLNAVFLPAVVLFNAGTESMRKDRRLARMAHAMGLPADGDDDAGHAVADAIRSMNARLGLPKGLATLGVERGMFERIVDGALADHCHKTNPRLATRDDYVRMLEASM